MDAAANDVVVPAGEVFLPGDLVVPDDAVGIVLFAHGSGSGRRSPRNRLVAETLNETRIGTLLIDLLTPEEERVDRVTGELRFDIPLLAERATAGVDWLRRAYPDLALGLFGASTGAAAAIVTAAERQNDVAAVVSRGGRPDLAGPALPQVRAPTLLIVGGNDPVVLELNEQARKWLTTSSELVVVPGATHLFEEPGALEEVARLAARWFRRAFPARE
jgi:pimeloyl-ACP methyl ester carboxylesterase